LKEKDIFLSAKMLTSLAQCATRMETYVTPDDQLLIIRLKCSDGTEVNLRLDMLTTNMQD